MIAVLPKVACFAYSYAVYQGATTKACRKTILDRNADFKAMIERMVGKDSDMGTEGSNVTSVTASVPCGYGDDRVETTGDPGDGEYRQRRSRSILDKMAGNPPVFIFFQLGAF